MIDEIRTPANLYLKWGKEYYGWGVFTSTPIKKGDLVEACYCLIDNRKSTQHGDFVYSVDARDTDVYLVLGYGSIYNHSEDPNVHQTLVDEERRIILIRALRDIEIGEELRWNYGKGYWDIRKNKKLL